MRLDQALAHLFPDFSRNRLQKWVKDGYVLVDSGTALPKSRVWSGERLTLQVPDELDDTRLEAEPMDLQVVHEDSALLVIHKPPGLVVHPGHGNWKGTLQNALLYRESALSRVPRCGIVHRLDKDTSGLMVVARTVTAHAHLVRQLQARTVRRHYWALVQGAVMDDGTVDAPVGRHHTQRTRMAVVSGGRPAVTHYTVVERLPAHTLLECQLETGRTHQIRVHMQYLGHALVGDPVYRGPGLPVSPDVTMAIRQFSRQALHAFRLGLIHPEGGQACEWQIPMEGDMADLMSVLRKEGKG